MAWEEFLCWGGQRLLSTVGLQCSLHGDAPTAQMSKLVRQDHFAGVGDKAAFGRMNPSLHIPLELLSSQVIRLQQER